jgi:hypothetical protein
MTIKKKNWEVNWEVRAVPRLCELYPGICLTTEEKKVPITPFGIFFFDPATFRFVAQCLNNWATARGYLENTLSIFMFH